MKAARGRARYIFRVEGVFAFLSFPRASFIKRSFPWEWFACQGPSGRILIRNDMIFVHDLFTLTVIVLYIYVNHFIFVHDLWINSITYLFNYSVDKVTEKYGKARVILKHTKKTKDQMHAGNEESGHQKHCFFFFFFLFTTHSHSARSNHSANKSRLLLPDTFTYTWTWEHRINYDRMKILS